jgi:hypothetical protein
VCVGVCERERTRARQRDRERGREYHKIKGWEAKVRVAWYMYVWGGWGKSERVRGGFVCVFLSICFFVCVCARACVRACRQKKGLVREDESGLVYLYTYIQAYIYLNIHTYICMYVNVCVCV